MLITSLLAYQPFAFLLAIIALIRGWLGGLRRIVYLSIWLFVALLLVVFLPARQMADLAWVLLPLNALAALELVRHFMVFPDERREVAGVVLLTVFIWALAWLGLADLNWRSVSTPDYKFHIGGVIGAVFLLAVSLLLVAAGWSIRITRIGGVWGMAICLGGLGLGNLNGNFSTGTGSDRTTGSFNSNTDSWSGTWTRYDSYCNANGQGTWQAVRYITHPDISVNPTTGTIKAVLERSKGMTFKVLNTGDGSLIINGLKVSGVDSSFFKIENDKCSGLIISPSESCTFDVVFLPLTKGEKLALVEIASNDPDNGTLSDQLSGIGVYPVNPALLQLLLDN